MSGTTDPSNPFVEWFLDELQRQNLSREEVARKAGIKSTGITNVVNRNKNLGPDLARAIANALGVRQRVVFAVARLIDDEGVEDAKEESELAEIRKELARIKDPKERERIRRILRVIVREANH